MYNRFSGGETFFVCAMMKIMKGTIIMKKFLIILFSVLMIFGAVFGGFTLANMVNRDKMYAYIDTFAQVEYENQPTPEYDENGVPYFVTDGDFKVMQLTDVHIAGGILATENDKKAINAVAAMITAEKPDLVVVTGDISFAVPWGGSINNKHAHEMFIRRMERLGVYWTVAFGNHDSEGYDFYNRSAVAGFYEDENLKYCLFDRGPDDVFGECNHIINVRNTKGLISKTVVVMDTNSYNENDPLGILWDYDNIHQDQIDWYKNQIESLNAYNKNILDSLPEGEKPENIDDFTTVQSLLFVHIPLMEVRKAVNAHLSSDETNAVIPEGMSSLEYLGGKIGEEAPYVYCSEKEEMMFETMLELGSTKGMFYGHDHLNNIVLELDGITLSYGYSIDYFAYSGISEIGSQRGCTVITCHPDTSFEVKHENYYQDKYVPLYEKEIVDMTK